MAIHATGNPANIRRSIEKFIVDTFVGATAFPAKFLAANVWWPGARIDTADLDYFLRVSLTEIFREFYAAGRDSVASYYTLPLLTLEVWTKRIAYETNPHILEQALATLRGGIPRGTAITIKDYDSGTGSTDLGKAIVERSGSPTYGPEDEWRSVSWDVTLAWTERDTTS